MFYLIYYFTFVYCLIFGLLWGGVRVLCLGLEFFVLKISILLFLMISDLYYDYLVPLLLFSSTFFPFPPSSLSPPPFPPPFTHHFLSPLSLLVFAFSFSLHSANHKPSSLSLLGSRPPPWLFNTHEAHEALLNSRHWA